MVFYCGKNPFNDHKTPPVKRVHFDVEFPCFDNWRGLLWFQTFNPSGKCKNSAGLIHQSVYLCRKHWVWWVSYHQLSNLLLTLSIFLPHSSIHIIHFTIYWFIFVNRFSLHNIKYVSVWQVNQISLHPSLGKLFFCQPSKSLSVHPFGELFLCHPSFGELFSCRPFNFPSVHPFGELFLCRPFLGRVIFVPSIPWASYFRANHLILHPLVSFFVPTI